MPASRPASKASAGRARAVRVPVQERSQQSLERILDAAEALIHERGFEALTVADLVERSRTSVGAFYGRFEDKAALLRAVHDRALDRLEHTFDERARDRPATASLAAAIHTEVEAFARLVSRDAALVRAFSTQAGDPVICKRAARTDQRHFAVFRSALLRHVTEIRHPEPERAIHFAYLLHATLIMSLSWTIRKPEGRLSAADTVAELSRMLVAYLQGGASAASRPKRRPAGRR